MKKFNYNFNTLYSSPIVMNRSCSDLFYVEGSKYNEKHIMLDIPLGKLEDATIPFYENNMIELKKVKAHTFYCDSISGGNDKSGDGTFENPWRSVNYALTKLAEIKECTKERYCENLYFQLKCSGSIDYIIEDSSNYDWGRHLIITNLNINFNYSLESLNLPDGSSFRNYYTCIIDLNNVIFLDVTVFGEYKASFPSEDIYNVSSDIYFLGFSSYNSVFSNVSCTLSLIYESGEVGSPTTYIYGVGDLQSDNLFVDCSFNCKSTVEARAPVVYTFCLGGGSNFIINNCNFESVSEGFGDTRITCYTNGIRNLSQSILSDCSSTVASKGTSNSYSVNEAFGFYYNSSCIFIKCTGSCNFETPFGDYYLNKGCGFYNNSNASFEECSTSEKVCQSSSSFDCTYFECDI